MLLGSARRIFRAVALAALVALVSAGCNKGPAPAPAASVGGVPGGFTGSAPSPAGELAAPVTGNLTVYTPCGMTIPIKEAIHAFKAVNPGLETKEEYDNAIVLVERILNKGEKTDIIISPGATEIGKLEAKDMIDPASKKAIGAFDLCVIKPKGSTLELNGPEDLRKCKTISIPDPAGNSVGACGEAALRKLGLWAELEPRMLKTNHAIQSHEAVIKKQSDAGIAYRACPLETDPAKMSREQVEICFDFPADSYAKEKCWVATMKDAANPTAAKAFIDFLTSAEGLKLLADNGVSGTDEIGGPAAAEPGQAKVEILIYYPDSGDHVEQNAMVDELAAKHGSDVYTELIDWSKDEGYKKWRAAGLSCGCLMINGSSRWIYEKDGEVMEPVFERRLGGSWTMDDLGAVVESLLGKNKANAKPAPEE